MMRLNKLDGMFFSLATEEELDEMMRMTKAELASIYVDWQVASGSINEPASRGDQEAFVAKSLRKPELIDGILMLREMAEADASDTDTDTDENNDFMWDEMEMAH